MPDPSTRHDELIQLVNGSPTPEPSDSGRGLARALKVAFLRAGRFQAQHQQRINRALAAWADERADRLDAEVGQIRGELEAIRAWLRATSDRGDELSGAVGWLRGEAHLNEEARTDLAQLHRRVAADSALGVEELGLGVFDDELGHRVLGFRGAGRRNGVYLGFEDVFRGAESVIADRQRAYLPLLRPRAPVLDIGCGRGELLELLLAQGVAARGVDLDADMVKRCLEKGLSVRRDDAVTALGDEEPGSLGAVVAAQVIEHLPYDELVEFLRAAATALRPGGLMILETVNPHSPQALKQFWIDPTHQHPLFPEVVLALVQIVGFEAGYIWHPQGVGDPERDRAEQPDYTVVGVSSAS